MESQKFICSICSSSFTRVAHLQRHQRSHSGDDSFQCSYCLLKFTRRDSLRKHWKSCLLRKAVGQPIPSPELRGRKRRACDQCSASKRACNLESPCGTCALKGCSCSYRRMSSQWTATPKSAAFSWIDEAVSLGAIRALVEGEEDATAPMRPGTISTPPSLPMSAFSTPAIHLDGPSAQQTATWIYMQVFQSEEFEFLMNFISCDGLNQSFNFLTTPEKGSDDWNLNDILSFHDLLGADYDVDSDSWGVSEKPSQINKAVEWLFDPLLTQTKAICKKLLHSSDTDACLPKGVTQSLDECIEFFNPQSLRRLLDIYWKRWHSNCPIIHPSTFEASQAPTELIMVMALIGAFVSVDRQDAENARRWLDSTERLIFMLPWLSQEDDVSRKEFALTLDTKLRLLQAAILISVLQTWEGTDSARKRIMKLRYPYVAHASQDLMPSSVVVSMGVDLATTLHQWSDFIIEEQIIRTKSFIFLLDTAFTIFHKTPPRVTIPDLDFPFPYPDVCFHSQNGIEFFNSVQQLDTRYLSSRDVHIYGTIQNLCHTNSTTNLSLPVITDLGGFILISAIHSIIFCQQMSCVSSPNATMSLLHSLEKWLALWDRRFNNTQAGLPIQPLAHEDDQTVRTGFVRHSREYYALALAKLEMIDRSHSGPVSQLSDSQGNVKDIISHVKSAWPSQVGSAAAQVIE
ncbi:hypothetical protein Trisim1_010466 [Trichoderma cf. simile WF8]